jgi:hypothetical protein
MGSILYLKEVPPVGGDTLFASMYAAYEGISDSMRRFLCGLTAIHDGARNYEGRRPAAERVDEFPRAEHPRDTDPSGDGARGAVRKPSVHDTNRAAQEIRDLAYDKSWTTALPRLSLPAS